MASSYKVMLDCEEHLNFPVLLTQRNYRKKKMPGEVVNASCRWSEVKGLKPIAEYKCSLELGGTQ